MSAEVSGMRALVAGIGVSGAAGARALARAGARVRAIDSASDAVAHERVERLISVGVDASCGVAFDDASLLDGVDLVVPSPGLAQGSPLLAAAQHRGVPVWSEPELAWRLSAGRTRLAVVTGTNGKTTTTELLAALLDAPSGGNIGTPLSELLPGEPPPLVVAELSSFQLRFTETLRAQAVVLLNISPDHLDWHGSLEAYEAAKARAWANSGPDDWVIVGDDDGARSALRAHPSRARRLDVRAGSPGRDAAGIEDGWITVDVSGARTEVAPTGGMAMRGRHNLANACAAVAAAVALGAEPTRMAAPLLAYTPGAHRLETVAEHAGVRWVDDSKATNPHAAAAALDAFAGTPEGVVWIAGGLAKGLRFDALEPSIRAHVRHAITIGASGPDLARLTRGVGVPTTEAGDLEHAVAVAAEVAPPGSTVLLAPACASMDQFRDYAERGRRFAALARARAVSGGSAHAQAGGGGAAC